MVGSHQTMLGMASNTKRRGEGCQEGMLGLCKKNAQEYDEDTTRKDDS